MPGDHVQRRVPDLAAVEVPAPLDGQRGRSLHVLERGDRRLEVAPVGHAVRADGPAFGQPELLAVVLAHEAARGPVDELHAVHEPARQDHDLLRLHRQHAELGVEAQPPLLRHHQQLRVRALEVGVPHGRGHEVDVTRHAALHRDLPGRRHRAHAVHPVERLVGVRHRIPAVLAERHDVGVHQRCGAPVRQIHARVASGMAYRRADSVAPGALVRVPRRREGGARQLLAVQSVGRALRAVAPLRQGAGQRLGLEVVAEAAHEARLGRGRGPVCRASGRTDRFMAGGRGELERGYRIGCLCNRQAPGRHERRPGGTGRPPSAPRLEARRALQRARGPRTARLHAAARDPALFPRRRPPRCLAREGM